MPVKLIKVAVYCRVSTEEQAERQTIQQQVEIAQAYCERLELPIYNFYVDDGVSGTLPMEKRPAGAKLLRDAEAGRFGAVVVYKLDRLARSTYFAIQAIRRLDELGVTFHSITEQLDLTTPNGKFLLTQLVAIAELERDNIVERTVRGKDASARNGFWPGGPPAYGYTTNEYKGRRILEVFEPEAEIVRRIYDLYVNEGMGLTRIAKYLNSLGVSPASMNAAKKIGTRKNRSGMWTTCMVSRILRRTVYKGEYVYAKNNGVVIQSSVPPIVSEETWNRAREQAVKNRGLPHNGEPRRYLLTGVLVCGLCGGRMNGDWSPRLHKAYYRCANSHAREYREPTCRGGGVQAEPVERMVWEDIRFVLKHPEVIRELLETQLREQEASARPVEDELASVEHSLGKRQIEREKIITLFRKNFISEGEVERELQAISDEIVALEARRDHLLSAHRSSLEIEERLVTAQVVLDKLSALADTEDDDAKRTIIDGFIDQVVVHIVGNPRRGQRKPVEVEYPLLLHAPGSDGRERRYGDERQALSFQSKAGVSVELDAHFPSRVGQWDWAASVRGGRGS